MNLDLTSTLHVSEVCERPDSGSCEKCGASWEERCQLHDLMPSLCPNCGREGYHEAPEDCDRG